MRPEKSRTDGIWGLDLDVRSHNSLVFAGIDTVEVLETKSDSELLRLKGFGRASLQKVREALRVHRGGMTTEQKLEQQISTIAREEVHRAIREELEPAIENCLARERARVIAAAVRVYTNLFTLYPTLTRTPGAFEDALLTELKRSRGRHRD